MDMRLAADPVARLEALGAGEAGSPAFPALAEAHRQQGDPERALEVAEQGLLADPDRVAGRVVRALALIDLGRVDEARRELVQVLERVPDQVLATRAQAELEESGSSDPLANLGDAELEDAFEEAAAEREQMIDANHVAEATLRAVDGVGSVGPAFPPGADSPFATETVAELLESQGHTAGARALRRLLEERRGGRGPVASIDRSQVIATLEAWLDNLRRGMQ